MAIDLNKKTNSKITSTTRKYQTPKSFRLQKSDLEQLENFKDRLKDLTMAESCSDTRALKVMLAVMPNVQDAIIKKALSKIL